MIALHGTSFLQQKSYIIKLPEPFISSFWLIVQLFFLHHYVSLSCIGAFVASGQWKNKYVLLSSVTLTRHTQYTRHAPWEVACSVRISNMTFESKLASGFSAMSTGNITFSPRRPSYRRNVAQLLKVFPPETMYEIHIHSLFKKVLQFLKNNVCTSSHTTRFATLLSTHFKIQHNIQGGK